MTPDLFRIQGPWPGFLAIVKRPRGGDWLEDELLCLREAGADIVVSLLEHEEESQLGLAAERSAAAAARLVFFSFPIPDRGVPASSKAAHALIRELIQALEAGKNVVIHCRQGLGRSPLIAIGLLMSAGLEPGSAIQSVSAARGVAVPETAEQRHWLENTMAGEILTTAGSKP